MGLRDLITKKGGYRRYDGGEGTKGYKFRLEALSAVDTDRGKFADTYDVQGFDGFRYTRYSRSISRYLLHGCW